MYAKKVASIPFDRDRNHQRCVLSAVMHFAAQNVLLAHLFEDCGMSSSQTRNRHTERRAGNVVQANLVAEHHGARIAAVFANKASPKTLNRATGVVLVILGVVIMLFNVLA